MRVRRIRSRRRSYGLLGLILASGAPTGLFALRLATGRASLALLAAEWRSERLTYLYVSLSTAAVFVWFGAALGHAADRLAREATSDSLTGLLNRAGLKARLEDELRRQRRYPAPLCLLLLDVDRLKAINDRLGHRAGDDALVRVARSIAATSRETDIASRWSGDEFVVLAPATLLADALVLAGRIRLAVAGAGDSPSVTVSIGVATVPPSFAGSFLDELLKAADGALYEAKRSGGNRVVTGRDAS